MRADSKRDYPNRYAGKAASFDKSFQLSAHDGMTSDDSMERRLVYYLFKDWLIFADQQLLPDKPNFDTLVDNIRAEFRCGGFM